MDNSCVMMVMGLHYGSQWMHSDALPNLLYSSGCGDCLEGSDPFRESFLFISSHNVQHTRGKILQWVGSSEPVKGGEEFSLLKTAVLTQQTARDAATPPSQVRAHVLRKHLDWEHLLCFPFSHRWVFHYDIDSFLRVWNRVKVEKQQQNK